ncbi:uncharacterized protein LOC123219503 isoform X2 [Mangifera indica]|uniref:uncharacterized protein LOC123219503 isoform X2 n=1 Tax=Mangifera indica TaxID=29780 RepID=UPI001CFB7308|nr:uncharacterized protein LOC123219503 isoform X2 [Mangifera indica]
MESALSLSYFPRPAILFNLNLSTMSVKLKQTTRLRSSHSCFSLSSGLHVTRRSPGHVLNFNAVVSELEKSSTPSKENEKKGDGRKLKGVVGASLVLACVVGIMSCSSKMNQKAAIAGPMEMYQKAPPTSVSIQTIGGNLALKSFLDVGVELASSSSKEKPFDQPKFNVPPGPSMEDINAIKMEAVRKMKSGKPEEAEKMLQDLYRTCQNELEPAYHAEMALVEILIYQGKYEEASYCNCLQEERRILASDGRFPLYKAIICTMLNNEEAATWWKEFAETVDGEFDQGHYF